MDRINKDSNKFENVVAIVTGGANGVGRSVCQLLSSGSARVFSIDIDNSQRFPAAGELVHCDVRDVVALNGALEEIEAKLADDNKELWFISAAGRALSEEFVEYPFPKPELFGETLDLNLISHYNFLWSSRKLLGRRGKKSFVLVSSINVLLSAGLVGYSAAKAGLLGLATTLAEPLLKKYHCCLTVALLGSVAPDDHARAEPRDNNALNQSTFRDTILSVTEAADSLLWLAGAPESLTGQAVVMDGGQTKKFVNYIDSDR
jgi:NAD(P)-dependent dehydrogenase (short-subunit alcohol dehydrogenase family)